MSSIIHDDRSLPWRSKVIRHNTAAGDPTGEVKLVPDPISRLVSMSEHDDLNKKEEGSMQNVSTRCPRESFTK